MLSKRISYVNYPILISKSDAQLGGGGRGEGGRGERGEEGVRLGGLPCSFLKIKKSALILEKETVIASILMLNLIFKI